MQTISIIILNYNGKDLIQKNLPNIIKYTQALPNVEIIVTDNGSTDNSVGFLKSSFPQVKVVALDKNYAFSKGFNLGIKTARNELLLLLNNDIEVTPDFLPPLIKHFEDPEVFGVTPKVVRPTQENITESIIVGGFKGGVISPDFSSTKKLDLPPLPLETFSVCGAAFMVDKKKFLKIGGFDAMLSPFYYEETDLSYRALKSGYKIIYEPRSLVLHQHNQSIGKHLKKSSALWSYRKNQYLCVWKNITDPFLLFRHILEMVIPKILIPNIIEWKALYSAFKQLPQAIKQRKKYPLTDQEVFKKAKEYSQQIKNFRQNNKCALLARENDICLYKRRPK